MLQGVGVVAVCYKGCEAYYLAAASSVALCCCKHTPIAAVVCKFAAHIGCGKQLTLAAHQAGAVQHCGSIDSRSGNKVAALGPPVAVWRGVTPKGLGICCFRWDALLEGMACSAHSRPEMCGLMKQLLINAQGASCSYERMRKLLAADLQASP